MPRPAALRTGAPAASSAAARPFTVHEVARLLDARGRWISCPAAAFALTQDGAADRKGRDAVAGRYRNRRKQKVAGVPAVHVAGQGGLGDVVVHPDFAGNRRVYLSFVEKGAGRKRRGARLWHAGDGRGPAADRRIQGDLAPVAQGRWQWPFQSHRMVFGARRAIYLSSGDRQKMDPAQAIDGNLGKVLHLDAEGRRWRAVRCGARRGRGAILVDGPPQHPRPGLRPRRPACGKARWGPKGGDELNLVPAGPQLWLAAWRRTAAIMTAAPSPITAPATVSRRPRCGGTRRSRRAGC